MEKIVIKGGKELKGEVNISTAKNSVLPILAASLLANNEVIIKEAPMLEDVFTICKVIEELGARVNIDKSLKTISINSNNIVTSMPNDELVKKMRASFLIVGPMVAKYGEFKLSEPGGCNIGTRPINLHLKGLIDLGVKIERDNKGYIIAKASKLIGNKIHLEFPSVGATENIMMAATLAKGSTIIKNAAEEPEIEDLANFLKLLGAKIYGAGTKEIIIEGVNGLNGASYIPIWDRIEGGTFMVAAAITGSTIKINGVNKQHCRTLIEILKKCGTQFIFLDNSPNTVIVKGQKDIKPMNISTSPYPGFPTDIQAQMMSLLSIAKGESIITETVFENRFMHAKELNNMGASINVYDKKAYIKGVNRLNGSKVTATDLRAGAALILAGLVASGETDIYNVFHIDRGYVNVEDKFKSLGADICRVNI